MGLGKDGLIVNLSMAMDRHDALASIQSGLIQLLKEGNPKTGWDTLDYYTANKEALTDKDKANLVKVVAMIKKGGWLDGGLESEDKGDLGSGTDKRSKEEASSARGFSCFERAREPIDELESLYKGGVGICER